MNEPTCPHCKTPIATHGATACLSAWVAEVVMGWEVAGYDHTNGGDLPEDCKGFLYDCQDGGEFIYIAREMKWHPHEEIAAAWEVVEHVDRWITVVGSPGGEIQIWEVSFDRVMARADTLPLAICRAAILAGLKETT